jgi:hypothetical protein
VKITTRHRINFARDNSAPSETPIAAGIAVVILTMVSSFLSSVSATTLKRMSVVDLAHAAHAIVRARCVGNAARWDAGEIWTFTVFDVEETWKGSVPSRISVRLLGGTSGNLTSKVSGIPRFAENEEAVLFLERTSASDFSVVSWVQGTFRISRDRITQEEIVTQDTAAFAVFDPVSHRFETNGIRRLPTSDFRSVVAAAIEAERGTR